MYLDILVSVIVLAVFLGIFAWAIMLLKLPEPWTSIIKVCLVIIMVIFLAQLLFVGPPHFWFLSHGK